METEDFNEGEGDFVFDQITGSRGKKKAMALLNKSKLSKYEMDDLFLEE